MCYAKTSVRQKKTISCVIIKPGYMPSASEKKKQKQQQQQQKKKKKKVLAWASSLSGKRFTYLLLTCTWLTYFLYYYYARPI